MRGKWSAILALLATVPLAAALVVSATLAERAVVDQVRRHLVGIADKQGTLLYFNHAARRFFDLPAHEPLPGENLIDIVAVDENGNASWEVLDLFRAAGQPAEGN